MPKLRYVDGPNGRLRVGDDITQLLERVPTKEAHFKVSFEALSARLRQSYDGQMGVEVNGELRSTEGSALAQNTKLVVAVYDAAGRVVALLDNMATFKSSFFEFDIFSLTVGLPREVDIARVLIYPDYA